MNDSNVFAEMLIEIGRITNELRDELITKGYQLERSEEEQKKLTENCEKYRKEMFAGQKSIEEWKAKYEALNKEMQTQKETIDNLKFKITKLRKRKK